MFDVTVILPNYNHGHYLPDCLKAIFSQSEPPREVLVIDDGSTDNSLLILNELKKQYSTLKILTNQQNMGIHESVNRGIFSAESTYLAFCSADDFVFPGFFEKCKEAFLQYPDVGLCFGDFAIFSSEEKHREHRLFQTRESLYLHPEDLIYLMKYRQFAINSYVAICRKDLSQKCGGYKKHLSCLADVYLCYQIACEYPLVYVPQVFASQRIEPGTYGQKIRWDFTKRSTAWDQFIKESFGSNNPQFIKFVTRSRLFGIGGYFILVFFLLYPQYWKFFPATFMNVLSRKLKKKRAGI